MISRFFIDRPVFATVLSVVITLIGLVTLLGLPIDRYPQITPPTVRVTAQYLGANAEVVEQTVAAPIEQQLNGVEKMLYFDSKSTNDGRLTITVTFEVGTDLDIAAVQVQNRVALAEPQLPEEVRALRHHRPQAIHLVTAGAGRGIAGQLLRPVVSLQLRQDQRARPAGAHLRRRRRATAGRARVRNARLAQARCDVQARPDHHRRDRVHSRAERAGGGGTHRAIAGSARPGGGVHDPRRGPAEEPRGVSEHHPPVQHGRLGGARARRGSR